MLDIWGSKSGYAQLKKKILKFFVVIASVQQKWGIVYAPFYHLSSMKREDSRNLQFQLKLI